MPPPTGIFQIRGPGVQPLTLVGPQVRVVGGGATPAGGFVSERILNACFAALAAPSPGAVAILMAATAQDKQGLVQRWGPNQSSAGWLVGRQTTAAALQQAVAAVGQGGTLRILIAADNATRDFLSNRWDET